MAALIIQNVPEHVCLYAEHNLRHNYSHVYYVQQVFTANVNVRVHFFCPLFPTRLHMVIAHRMHII